MVHIVIYIKNKKLKHPSPMILRTLKTLVKWLGSLFLPSMSLNGILLLLITTKIVLGKKSHINLPLELTQKKTVKKRENIINKPTSIEILLSLILAKSLKEVNEISKYFKSNRSIKTILNQAKLYTQSAKNISNTEKVLKIKEAFSSLQVTNIDNIQKIIKRNNNPKPKLHINMTTKGPLHKQVIISISNGNKKNFMNESGIHVLNMNRVLKNIKSDVMVDFIHSDVARIIVVTNKVTTLLDLQSIKQYIKGANHINSNEINFPRLPQSKLYLKIISLLYLQENIVNPINSNVVKNIIKDNHIFNNIMLASKLYVIKVSPKSDIAIV